MRDQFRPARINFASVDISGGPGLGVVAVVVAVAFQFEIARWLLLAGIAGGAVLAAATIFIRRRSDSTAGESGPPDAFAQLSSLNGRRRAPLDDGHRQLRRILSGMMHDVVGDNAV